MYVGETDKICRFVAVNCTKMHLAAGLSPAGAAKFLVTPVL